MSDQFSCERMKEWRCLATIEELDIASSKITDADLAVIAKMRRLKNLKLNSGKLSAKGVAELEKLPQLEMLSLTSVEFIGNAQGGATQLTSLKRLEIENCPQLTDDVVVAMGKLPALEDFVSNRTPLGDRAVGHVIGNGKLHLLIMNQSHVTDAGLGLLSGFPRPISLHIAESQVTDVGLRYIAGLQLESLVLDHTGVTDAGLNAMGPLHGLWYLSLDETKICGTGLACCDPTVRIPSIRLQATPLSREGLRVLATLNVAELSLLNTDINDSDLLLFANNDLIGSLDVRETKVTAAGIKNLYEHRKKRLKTSGQEEILVVVSDFGGIADEYLPESEQYRISDAVEQTN
ncbi:MAG TPA: hypothetical protein VGI40_12820 [Pirellulaceae bacterium]